MRFYYNLKQLFWKSDLFWIFSIITPVFSATWSFRNH